MKVKNGKNPSNMWDTVKRFNIHIMEILGGKEKRKEKMGEVLKIMAKKFPK